MPCRLSRLLACLCPLAVTPAALAHSASDAPTAQSLLLEWLVVGCMAAAIGCYARGILRLWRNAGAGAGVSKRQAACFFLGWIFLLLALLSPIDSLGDKLFSMHMVQHEVMMLLAAPLLVAGRPLVVFIWAFPSAARSRIGTVVRLRVVQYVWAGLTRPLSAWLLHVVVLWAWHFPSLFQASLANDWVHAAQHASFLVSALLFWSALMAPHRGVRQASGQYEDKQKASYGASMVYVLTTAIHTGILGALLTFSSVAWYPVYAGRTEHWGLTLLEDQQLGGLIMWVPAGFILLAAGLMFAARAIDPARGSTREAVAHGKGQA
jgi:putative membrane protein